MRAQEFLISAHQAMLAVESKSETLLDRLTTTRHAAVPKPVHLRNGAE